MASESLERIAVEEACRLKRFTSDELIKAVEARLGSVDRRVIRRVIGELVRRGVLRRLPGYGERRHVFEASREACGGEGAGL